MTTTTKKPRTKLPPPIPERFVEDAVLQYLNALPGCFAFKVKTGGYFDPKRKAFRKDASRWLIPGTADIIGVYDGRFFAMEVKRSRGGIVSEEQKAFIEKVELKGGKAGVVRSVEDAQKIISRFHCSL
jgi:penicillin-binding protein-related factor A (putative recombinase)